MTFTIGNSYHDPLSKEFRAKYYLVCRVIGTKYIHFSIYIKESDELCSKLYPVLQQHCNSLVAYNSSVIKKRIKVI